MPDLTINLEYFSNSVTVFLDGWSTGSTKERFLGTKIITNYLPIQGTCGRTSGVPGTSQNSKFRAYG
jgi:hypothetical protein